MDAILSSFVAGVLPTRVGMVRVQPLGVQPLGGSPHTRGDGPPETNPDYTALMFSPHAWGWSASGTRDWSGIAVLPTRVGMVWSTTITYIAP